MEGGGSTFIMGTRLGAGFPRIWGFISGLGEFSPLLSVQTEHPEM